MENMVYRIYQTLVSLLFLIVMAFFPFFLCAGKLRYRIRQRFACYPDLDFVRRGPVLWFHAASIGEVQALRPLLQALRQNMPGSSNTQWVVTVMTEQGHRVASQQLQGEAICLLAPLDVPWLVRRALRRIRPDAFISLETELWPVMLMESSRAGIPLFLVNGRMSEGSFKHYLWLSFAVRGLLRQFSGLALIGEEDRLRYERLGAPAARIQVTGNAKFDYEPLDSRLVRQTGRRLLGLNGQPLFIAGSTRDGEEKLLIPVYQTLLREAPELVWMLAPRHLERLGAVCRLLQEHDLEFELLSTLKNGARRCGVVVVDSMGELAQLYAAGDYVFCGGSLVDKGGHNIMEVVRWGLPVYFGPSMKDFRAAAKLLLDCGAGFQVANSAELSRLLLRHMRNAAAYTAACKAAEQIVVEQRGAAGRQAAMIVAHLQPLSVARNK